MQTATGWLLEGQQNTLGLIDDCEG